MLHRQESLQTAVDGFQQPLREVLGAFVSIGVGYKRHLYPSEATPESVSGGFVIPPEVLENRWLDASYDANGCVPYIDLIGSFAIYL
jgi:hypothetical protein